MTAAGGNQHLEEARASYDAGDFRRARELARSGLAERPDDPALLRIAGRAGIELGLDDAADELAAGLVGAGVEGVRVLGPSPGFPLRLRGLFRWQLTLKGSGLARARDFAPRGRGWSFDVDPVL
jgi:hypothetical protein